MLPDQIKGNIDVLLASETKIDDTVDSIHLDLHLYLLFRISLHLEQNVRSLEISPKNTA